MFLLSNKNSKEKKKKIQAILKNGMLKTLLFYAKNKPY